MILEQRGSTCGIYAFLNGVHALYSLHAPTQEINEAVITLIRDTCYGKKGAAGETLLGEFFSCEALASFLNQHSRVLSHALEFPLHKAKIIPITALGTYDDGFYIVPGIRKHKWYERERNASLHWMTALIDGRVLNSAYATEQHMTMAELEAFNDALLNRRFSWPLWRRQNSYDLSDEAVSVPTSREMRQLENDIPHFSRQLTFERGSVLYVSKH